MARKCHNESLHINPWYHEEEKRAHTATTQLNQSNRFSPPQQGDCKTMKDTKNYSTKNPTQKREEDKDQESIQSSSTPDPEYHMGT